MSQNTTAMQRGAGGETTGATDMTTQQPGFSMSQYASSKDLFAAMIARITELESQLAQRFDAADMATAAAQGFRDGVASLSANAGEPRNAIGRDALIDAIAQGLHGTWHCTRVWEAWHVGTMSQDDFKPVDESETPTEIADAVLALLAAPPAAQAADSFSEYGAVTTHSVTGQKFFYAAGAPPYLDNASECVTVYAKQKQPRPDDQGTPKDGWTDSSPTSCARGLGADQHHEHRARQSDRDGAHSECNSGCHGIHGPCDISQEVAAPTAQAADSVTAVEREQERIAFKDAHRHLELYEVPDAWGRPMFKHSHVEASWLGWIARASHGQAPAGAAQAADSVQEDAADPLQGAANWLAEAHGQFSPVVLSGCLMIGYNRAKRLHDAALAARKQGASQ